MEVIKYPSKDSWKTIAARPVLSMDLMEQKVRPILQAVKSEGDEALKRFSKQFDNAELTDIQVTAEELTHAEENVENDLKRAIAVAVENIRKFHEAQQERTFPIETMPGVVCWRKSIAIQKVGIYIPGGTAPLFSTVLMLAIPALIAGCEEIILCSPPGPSGTINPVILYVAKVLGLKKVFKVGGAQAVAAMAYGTESVPKVDKIFGPGNQYVTAAKQLVNREGTGIDMPAGPSEVAVLADHSGNPAFIAADLLSQAEHGSDSQVLLVTTEEKLAEKVIAEVEAQLKDLERKELAISSLHNSKVVVVKDIEQGMELVNFYAPEHLILQVENVEVIADKVKNAGSVFLGNYTPEAAGDYASGTNHTLPTSGYARIYSGVSVDSYVKKVTFQQISGVGLRNLGPSIEIMAQAEQLTAHKNAVSIRLKELEK